MSDLEKWQDIAGIMTQGEYTQRKKVLELERQVADLTAKLKAKDSALEFATAAIGDAIYLEEGLDGETGQRVQRIIAQALERGTFDVPGELGDFLVKRERAAQDQIADLTRRLEAAQRSYDALSATRDALKAKLAAVEQERNTMRTALLALPGVVKELEQALDVLDNYYDGAEGSSIKWLGAPTCYVRNAKERLAQAMRGM